MVKENVSVLVAGKFSRKAKTSNLESTSWNFLSFVINRNFFLESDWNLGKRRSSFNQRLHLTHVLEFTLSYLRLSIEMPERNCFYSESFAFCENLQPKLLCYFCLDIYSKFIFIGRLTDLWVSRSIALKKFMNYDQVTLHWSLIVQLWTMTSIVS